MKIALFGGSFNPIHLGHVLLSRAVLQELNYQKIIFMPTFVSPLKQQDNTLAFPLDRFNMVKLAIENEELCECSSYEIERDESSFTINTIRHLYSLYQENEKGCIEGKLGLIIGSDQLLQFKKWKNYEEILNLCDIIVASRIPVPTGKEEVQHLKETPNTTFEDIGFKFTLLQTPILPISSTAIRKTIIEDINWKRHLSGKVLDAKVANYIEENALYGSPFDTAFKHIESLIADVETYAKSELSEKRFLHSMRVARMAEHLASIYPNHNVPRRLAYLAGIAHDITKEKTDLWQKKTIEAAGETIDEVEHANLRLLHGRTAAILLKKYFCIQHRSLLDAIKNHTFAHPLLDYLGKILYIADKIEEGRRNVEDLQTMVGTCSIDEIMIALLEKGEASLKAKAAFPHPYAVELLKRLKRSKITF